MMKKFVTISLVLLFLVPVVFAQKSRMILKERGTKTIKGTIFVSDRNGKKDPSATEFENDKYLNLFIEPEKGNLLFKFARRDADTIRTYLSLLQGTRVALPVQVTPISKNFPTKEFLGVVVSFEKKNVDIAKSFLFNYLGRKSDEILLPEKYWLGFNDYYKNLVEAKESLQAEPMNPVKGLQLLEVFTPDDSLSMTFSFSSEARLLSLSTAQNYLVGINNQVVELHNKNAAGDLIDADEIALSKLEEKWRMERDTLRSFFSKDDVEEAQILDMLDEVDMQFTVLEANLATKVLLDYSYNEYKYELFVTLISKLLIDQPHKGYLSELKPINFSNKKKYAKEISDLKQFKFYDEFQQLLALINENIRSPGYVLSGEVMGRLRSMRNDQPYPNYEIISAFNAYAANDTEVFLRGLDAIQNTTSDEKLIEDVANWKNAAYYSEKKVDRDLILRISDAISLLDQNQVSKAAEQFQLAYKLNRRLPVTLYYIGYTYYLQGQEYTGIKFFRKALEIDPSSLIPYMKELEFYRHEEHFDLAIDRVNAALTVRPNNWYLLSQKAHILYGLNRTAEAEEIIIRKMIPLSPSNVEQYFLLGDIYAKQGDFSRAREVYHLGGDLDPTNYMFEEKMRDLEIIERDGGIPGEIRRKQAPKKEKLDAKEMLERINNKHSSLPYFY